MYNNFIRTVIQIFELSEYKIYYKRLLFKQIFSLLMLMIMFVLSATGQRQLGLDEAISLGLKNNYNVVIAQSEIEAAKQRNSWGYAGALPSLSVGANARTGVENDAFGTTITPAANLNFTIFNGFRVRLTKERYGYLEKLSQGNATLVLENTMQAIILGYYSVLLEHERLNVLKVNMELSKDRYDYIKNRVDMGSGSRYELLLAQNSYLTDQSLYLNQEMVQRAEKRTLAFILAEKSLFDYELTDSLQIIPEEFTLSKMQEEMLSDNQSLKNQYLNLELLRVNSSISRSPRYPSLALNGAGNYTFAPESLNDQAVVNARDGNYTYYGSLVLSYTLFDGTKISRDIKIADIEKRIGDVETEQMEHELTNYLANIYDLYEVRKDLMTVAKENKEAAQLNLAISSDKYKNGSLTSFEFRDVQQVYLQASLSYIQSVYNLIETHTDLLRMTGRLLTTQ